MEFLPQVGILCFIVASDALRSAYRGTRVPGHGELYTATLGHCVVGQAFQFTVLLGVHLEEAQVSLPIEVALTTVMSGREGDYHYIIVKSCHW